MITNQVLTELCQQWSLFDRYFKIAGLDINVTACNYNPVAGQFNPNYGVIRHEFLELFVRIAMDKYYKSGMCSSESEAVMRLLDGLSKNMMKKYDISKWKWQRLYNEDCDTALTAKINLLQGLYNTYATRSITAAEKIFLTCDEFLQFCSDTDQFTAVFTARQATMCFHLAMLHQINEVDSNKHMRMSFFEFIEAFAMIVECQDSPDTENALFNFERIEKSLYEKIEEAFIALAPYARQKNKSRTAFPLQFIQQFI